MKLLKSAAFIGNYLPRRCGIATFTHDLHRAVAANRTGLETCVVAMTDPGGEYNYPDAVQCQIRDNVADDYVKAAAFLNGKGFDVVSLQHEYGIFGGEAGSDILKLLSRLNMPIVTTLHTVLREPSAAQRTVIEQVLNASAKIVVMSEKGRDLLRCVHAVPASKIEVIPHGIPEVPFAEPNRAKAKFGFSGKSVILTFGLLSPSKGIETVIDAMPAILKSCPNAVYVVLGATHPNLIRHEGEAYRERLTARAGALGVADHVVFLNQFVDQATLLDYIAMCDVYATPYLNEAQMTSGTLAYSFGSGKAVVSTPYWHAQELLADGRGILVPFGDVTAIGSEIAALLTNDVRRHAMRKRAYAFSRSMVWAQTAKAYVMVFESALAIGHRNSGLVARPSPDRHQAITIPEVRTGHLLAMCDSTGLQQHAVHSIPDRAHGYCIDDNARALLLASSLGRPGEPRLPEKLTSRFAAFLQHAWNPDNKRFRNFMSYDRRWLEDTGSEDSHGRTLWALGVCTVNDFDPSRRRWAEHLFAAALGSVEGFSSPRAWAFTLLGLDAYCPLNIDDRTAERLRHVLADRLMVLYQANHRDKWQWFENVLAYDNARLPQALIQTGQTIKNRAYLDAGLGSLRWLMELQTAPAGCFRPVGSDSFGEVHQMPAQFDQQPVEAAASISACLAAARAESSSEWSNEAMRAFQWFLGANDLRTALVDPNTGGCRDGLHPDRPNENQGAESVLSYLLGLVEIRQLGRTNAVIEPIKATSTLALSA